MILSTFVGTILCLTVEYPMSGFTRMLIETWKQKIADKNETSLAIVQKEDDTVISTNLVESERHDFSRETRQI